MLEWLSVCLPLTVSCYSKIHIGFTFLVPAHLGSPGRMAVERVYPRYIFYIVFDCEIFRLYRWVVLTWFVYNCRSDKEVKELKERFLTRGKALPNLVIYIYIQWKFCCLYVILCFIYLHFSFTFNVPGSFWEAYVSINHLYCGSEIFRTTVACVCFSWMLLE